MKNTNQPSTAKSPRRPVRSGVNYRSKDGAVEILTKVGTARRRPQHGYPIVCIRLRPKAGTRIQSLPDGEGMEILLSHVEVAEHLKALNAADPKARYRLEPIPEKPASRKDKWNRINQKHHQSRRQP